MNKDGESAMEENNRTVAPQPAAEGVPAAPAKRTGGLYARVKMSVRAANIMVAVLAVALVLVMIFAGRHAGFTVSFDTDGGSAVEPVKAMYSDTVSLETPVKEGWRFTGWYTDRACTARWSESDPVTGSMTLYAGWEKK